MVLVAALFKHSRVNHRNLSVSLVGCCLILMKKATASKFPDSCKLGACTDKVSEATGSQG